MAEKNLEYPFAIKNGYSKSDQELGSLTAEELKRKKRIKLAIHIAIFAVFQIVVITVFGLVIMRVKSPKLRLSDIEFQNVNTTSGSSSLPLFDISFRAQVRVKNSNFGPYKFDNTTATFTYDGVTVGQLIIPKGKARMKSTKKISVFVSLSSTKLQDTANLVSELTAGMLTLGSTATMTGKVELMLITKKKKSADMSCIITVDVNGKNIRTLQCK